MDPIRTTRKARACPALFSYLDGTVDMMTAEEMESVPPGQSFGEYAQEVEVRERGPGALELISEMRRRPGATEVGVFPAQKLQMARYTRQLYRPELTAPQRFFIRDYGHLYTSETLAGAINASQGQVREYRGRFNMKLVPQKLKSGHDALMECRRIWGAASAR